MRHFCGEHPALAQVLDQLARKPFAGFGFRGPSDDVVVEHLVEQRPVFVDAQLCGHVVTAVQVAFDFQSPQLARRGARQRARPDEHHVGGHDAALRGHLGDQLAAGAGFVGAAEFGGDHQAGPGRVVVGADGDHGTLTHAAYFGGDPFDLGGEDVAARDGDDLLGPPADHQAVVGEVAQIAGREPRAGLQCGVAEVAGHHRGAADLDLADLAAGQFGGALRRRADPDFHPGDRLAQNRVPARFGIVCRRRRTSSNSRPVPGAGMVTAQVDSASP